MFRLLCLSAVCSSKPDQTMSTPLQGFTDTTVCGKVRSYLKTVSQTSLRKKKKLTPNVSSSGLPGSTSVGGSVTQNHMNRHQSLWEKINHFGLCSRPHSFSNSKYGMYNGCIFVHLFYIQGKMCFYKTRDYEPSCLNAIMHICIM